MFQIFPSTQTEQNLGHFTDGKYAQAQREKLSAANRRKKASGNSTRAQILAASAQSFAQTGKIPTWAELGSEVGVSRRTVAYHVAALKEAGLYPDG
ncbi:hypothetical protein ACL1GI_12570 [Corynebacterium striatum]